MLSRCRTFFHEALKALPSPRNGIDTPGASRGLARRLQAILDWRPRPFRISRGKCHRLTLTIRGIPKRLLASTIRLQVMNISGLQNFGLTWRVQDETAEIWYWDETRLQELDNFPAAEALVNGIQPCPEMLFRTTLEDGIHLVVCSEGYEALALDNGQVKRTRWFSRLPDSTAWMNFVRDAGKIPENHPLPASEVILLQDKPARGWTIQSSLVTHLPIAIWLAVGGTVLVGMFFASLLAYDLKQNQRIDEDRATLEQLTREKAVILDLQKQIDRHTGLFQTISGTLSRVPQLRLMQALSEAGIFSEGTGISLNEWEYRNERLRLLFSVPKEDFSLGLFLSTLENTKILDEIRLMPDTPAQTIGIQAVVRELPPLAPPADVAAMESSQPTATPAEKN